MSRKILDFIRFCQITVLTWRVASSTTYRLCSLRCIIFARIRISYRCDDDPWSTDFSDQRFTFTEARL